jgi:acetyl-CoA carboxylase carboxyl transferase subunit alpha
MPPDTLEFEEPIAVLLREIEALSMLPRRPSGSGSIDGLHRRIDSIRGDIYRSLTPWQRCWWRGIRTGRPSLDYVNRLFTEFTEISGDRRFADDHAMWPASPATRTSTSWSSATTRAAATPSRRSTGTSATRARGLSQGAAGDEAGREVRRPVLAFIDTPAAYPGMESEERGISEAIAVNLREMMVLDTPIIVVVHGEGGSGGRPGHRRG